jgi:PAS domain S-box-containing protein
LSDRSGSDDATVSTRASPRLAALAAENRRLAAALASAEDTIAGLRASTRFAAQIPRIADALPVLISYLDARQRYRFNNLAYERWTGEPRAALVGRHVSDVFGAAGYRELQPLIETALAGEAVSAERAVSFKDGTVRQVRIDYVPDRRDDGTVAGLYALVQDITETHRSAEALRESEARFRAVADSAPAPVWVTGADGIEFVNKALLDFSGLSADQLSGTGWTAIIHPDDLPELMARRTAAWAGADLYNFTARMRRHDGEWRWLHASLKPRFDVEGAPAGFVGMALDVTDAKRAEAELRESEARFRAIADSAPSPVWVTGENGIEFVNTAYTEVAGRPGDALTGNVWMDLIHPDDLPEVLARRAEAWESGSGYGYDARFRHADGALHWMKVSCRPRFDHDGKLIGYVGMAVDISDAKRAEAELREDKKSLETLNRIGASLAPALDLAQVVQMVTDAGVELSGAAFGAFFYNVVDAAGESYMLYTISGVDRAHFDKFPMPRNTAVFAPTFAGEGVVRSDDIKQDPRYGRNKPRKGMPKGHLPVTSYLAVPVVSRSGEVIGGLFFGHPEPARFSARHEQLLVGIAGQAAVAIDNARLFEAAQRELGERRRAEAALRELNQSLEQRVAAAIAEREQAEEALRQSQKMEAVGQLTGGIAHDFNNLLTIITGNVDAARRHAGADAPARLQRALASALVGAERAATLTQRLLAFSRRQPLNPRPTDANKLVTGMSDLLHRTLGETIAIETRLAPGLWKVEADPNQLENAILNLAVNARDAMPDGGTLLVETANVHLDRGYAARNPGAMPGQYVSIRVADIGTGMDAETLARAFEPFFTTKEVGKGTGLGLSMVYGFVKQSGGHLAIESEAGQGTIVRIYLPRLLGDAAQEDEPAEAPVPEGTREETILVCEDDDDVRAYTVEVLRELGYRVLEAHDAPSALRLLERQESKVDLLFTDVVLPGGMTGAVLAREARALRPELSVLFTTGYARDAIVHHGRLDPGIELIAKPFAYADLAARVRDMLDRGG